MMAVADNALVRSAGNPEPPGVALFDVETADRVRLRAAFWPATRSACVGTICLMQGRAEFIEKYFETIADLRARGFAVFTFDWRGQGGSQRLLSNPRKGHVGGYREYVRDLTAVLDRMSELGCPPPFYGLAHSMGGAAMLLALTLGERRLARGMICAPLVALHSARVPRHAGMLAELLGAIGGARSFIPGGGATSVMTRPFAGNFLTADPERYARTANVLAADGRVGIGDPTVGWIRATYRLVGQMRRLDFGFGVTTPTLFVLAGADTLVSSDAAEALAQRVRGAASVVIAGSRHEIMMERDPVRSEFFAALDAFLPGELARTGAD